MQRKIFIGVFLIYLIFPYNTRALSIKFTPTFRADWAHIDRAGLYDYSPTAFSDDDGKWKSWYCAANPGSMGYDHIYRTFFTLSGSQEEAPAIAIAPTMNDANLDGRHTCAPSVFKHTHQYIYDGAELYSMYYECAPKIYPKCRTGDSNCNSTNPDCYTGKCDPNIIAEGFTQICHAVSFDGKNWLKYNENYWDTNYQFAPANFDPTPVIKINTQIKQNCQYEFTNGKHQAVFYGTSGCQDLELNYGVGHPSALVLNNQIWLYYYDSRGNWNDRAVYLAKSWDGFYFDPPQKTNLQNPVDVKFMKYSNGGGGAFIATLGIWGSNYYAYSNDGLQWTWPSDSSDTSQKFGTALNSHCAAPGQPSIISDKFGSFNEGLVHIFSGEGFLGTNDFGVQNNCYSSQEDVQRGSTWGIYLISGNFSQVQSIAGDTNSDGHVDIFDFNNFIANFGNATCSNPADFDKNCRVDIFDYNILLNNFGK
jgi:hypothetical protein